MAHDEYPLLPASIPDPEPAPVPVQADEQAGEVLHLGPPDLDPAVAARIHVLATDALPAWTATSVAAASAAAAATVPRLRVVSADPAPRRSRLRSCLWVGLALLVIVSLLASSAFSLFWFLDTRAERVAEVEAQVTRAAIEVEAAVAATAVAEAPLSSREQPALLPARASGEPVNRIVFTNSRADIETIAPDGSEQRQITSDNKAYQLPAWSPDGRYVASVGANMEGSGIYLIPDMDEPGAPTELFAANSRSPFYLYWSPDGEQISFLASSRVTGMELNVMPASGGDSRVLAIGSPMYWNWAANSRQMLIHSGDTGVNGQIALISDEGQIQPPRITSPGYFQAPGISASGRYWAYSQVRGGDTNWLITDDRESDVQVGHRHAGAVALSWSPTRDEVAFISGDPDSQFSTWGPLRVLDAATDETRLLSNDTVLAFFWSPDGEKIATISLPANPLPGEQFEVRNGGRRQLVGYEVRQPAQHAGHTFLVAVIDVATGEEQSAFEAQLSPTFMAQFLPYFDQYALSHNIWAPDSSAFVLPLITERVSEVTVVDAEDGGLTPLSEGQMAFWTRN
jgi:TolB protein